MIIHIEKNFKCEQEQFYYLLQVETESKLSNSD